MVRNAHFAFGDEELSGFFTPGNIDWSLEEDDPEDEENEEYRKDEENEVMEDIVWNELETDPDFASEYRIDPTDETWHNPIKAWSHQREQNRTRKTSPDDKPT